jgi:cell division septation protein DedD
MVLLGAHRNTAHALHLARRTRTVGLPAYVEDDTASVADVRRAKVRAGPFATRAEAETALMQLSRLGIDGRVSQH